VKRYELTADDALIRLEPSHSGMRGFYWLFNVVVFFLDGWLDADTPLDLVIRDPDSRAVLYRKGSFSGAEAIAAATEAKRVIDSLGVDGYVRRETE
jgi:hypothetical protein